MPQVFWQGNRWVLWVAAFGSLILILSIILGWASGDQPPLWLLVVIALLGHGSRHRAYILAGGVLTVLQGDFGQRHVPLAAAQMKERNGRWHFHWHEGKRRKELRLTVPASFGAAVERAVHAAQTADAGALPLTEAAAKRAMDVGRRAFPSQYLVASAVLAGAVLLLGILLAQPTFLVPFLMSALFALWSAEYRLVMLWGDHLWLLYPDREPESVPVQSVHALKADGYSWAVLTSDPDHEEIKLDPARSSDLVRHLRQRLKGDRGPSPEAGAPADGAVRCIMCGRPETAPGATSPLTTTARALSTAAPALMRSRTVHVCDRCSGKARSEAAGGGHGLKAKEPMPM